MKKQFDIFISYRRDGGLSAANMLYEHLTRAGYSVFMDYEKLRSGKFNEQLYEQIENCKEVIVVLAENSLERCKNEDDWLRLEIAHALKLHKVIIPVMLRNFKWPDSLPDDINELNKYHGIEASQELFNAFFKKLQKLLKSKRKYSWKRVKNYVLFALVPIIIASGVLFFVHIHKQKEEQKEYKQYEQICKEVVSLMGSSFVNGNQLITSTKNIKEEWNKFHQNFQKATEQVDKKRIKDEFCKYLDFKLSQVIDTTNIIQFTLSQLYEDILSKNGIKTEDIKAYPTTIHTDINNTKDYIEKVKYWAMVPETGWLEEIDKAIDILAQLNNEMISGTIYAYMQIINSMPKSVQENYLKILPLLTKYPTDLSFNSTFKELEAKQNLSFQKCNNLLQQYSEIVGDEKKAVQGAQAALDLLKTKVKNQAHKDVQVLIAAKKDSLKAKKKLLGQKETELEQKKILVRQGYQRILAKDSLLKNDDQWLMWGKILHLAKFGYDQLLREKESTSNVVTSKEVFAQVQKRLDLYLEYNKAKDSEAIKYVPAAKQYFSFVSQNKLEYTGIIMVGTQENVTHPVLKTGDIIIERKGKLITCMNDYTKLKEDPATNVIKIIRFVSGKKTLLTETIPADCKVLVGFLNLKSKE